MRIFLVLALAFQCVFNGDVIQVEANADAETSLLIAETTSRPRGG